MRPIHEPASATPLIALLTDFGSSDHYVAVVKGVIALINPLARVVDVSHDVKPHSIREAAYLLWASFRFFPGNSIFVTIVDPGVGSDRRILVVRTEKNFFVAPDNGVLDLVGWEEKFKECHAVNVKHSPFILAPVSATFHGRDIFAPVAAYLSNGVPCSEFGPSVKLRRTSSPFVSSPNVRRGVVLHCDRFGNMITNIRNEMFDSLDAVKVGKSVVTKKTSFYGEGNPKSLSLIKGSSGLVEIVVKEGSASELSNGQPETSLQITWR